MMSGLYVYTVRLRHFVGQTGEISYPSTHGALSLHSFVVIEAAMSILNIVKVQDVAMKVQGGIWTAAMELHRRYL